MPVFKLRKAPRKPTRHAGWINFGDSPTPIACVLWDVSEHGARIAVAHARLLPDRFTLDLSRDGQDRRFCRVVWRQPPQVGVQFVAEPL